MFDCANHFRWGKLAIWFLCTCQCQLCIHTNVIALILFYFIGSQWRGWRTTHPEMGSILFQVSLQGGYLRLRHLLSEAQPKPDSKLFSNLIQQPRLLTHNTQVLSLRKSWCGIPRSPSSPTPSSLLHFHHQSPHPKDTCSESGCPAGVFRSVT